MIELKKKKKITVNTFVKIEHNAITCVDDILASMCGWKIFY